MSLKPPSTSRAFRSALLRLPIRVHSTPLHPLPLPFLSRCSSTATTTATQIETPHPPIAPAPASLPPTSVPNPASLPSNSTIPTPTSLPPTSLPWNEYLQLRRKRRHYNLFFSLATAGCTTGAGVIVLGQQSFEHMSLFGLDPFLVLGLATMASGAVGWLLGPFIGNAVFGIVWRRSRGQIAAVSSIFVQYFSFSFLLQIVWMSLRQFLLLHHDLANSSPMARNLLWTFISFLFSLRTKSYHINHVIIFAERPRLLRAYQTSPRRSIQPILLQPCPGLLRRENWQRQGVSELDEGSTSVQQETAEFLVM